jgi:hypothetical protein
MGFKVEIWTEVDGRVVRRVRKGTGGYAELAAVLDRAVDALRAELGLSPARSGFDELGEAFARVPLDTWGSLLWTLVNAPAEDEPGAARAWGLLPLVTRERWSRSADAFLSYAVRWARDAQDGRAVREHVDAWWAELHRGMSAFAATARAFRGDTLPGVRDLLGTVRDLTGAEGFRLTESGGAISLRPDVPGVLPPAEGWADLLRLAVVDGEPDDRPWSALPDRDRDWWVRRAEQFREAWAARFGETVDFAEAMASGGSGGTSPDRKARLYVTGPDEEHTHVAVDPGSDGGAAVIPVRLVEHEARGVSALLLDADDSHRSFSLRVPQPPMAGIEPGGPLDFPGTPVGEISRALRRFDGQFAADRNAGVTTLASRIHELVDRVEQLRGEPARRSLELSNALGLSREERKALPDDAGKAWDALLARVSELRRRSEQLAASAADELGDPSAEVLAGWLGSALSETEGMPHGALIEDVKGDPERLHLFLSAMAQRVLERSAAAGARMVADVTRGVPAKVLAGWLRVALEGAERELDTPVGDASCAPDEWEAMLTLAAAGVLRQAAAVDPTPVGDEGRSGTETAALELGGRLTAHRLREAFERAERLTGITLGGTAWSEADWRALTDTVGTLLAEQQDPSGLVVIAPPAVDEPQGPPPVSDTATSPALLGRWMGVALQDAARTYGIDTIRIPARSGEGMGSAGPLMESAAARLLERLGADRRRMAEVFAALAPVVAASEPAGFERFVAEQSIDSPGDPVPAGSAWGAVQSAYSTTLSRYHRVLRLLGGGPDPRVVVAGSEMSDPSVRAVRVLAHLDRAVDLLYTRDRANPDLWWVSGRDDDGKPGRADRPITWPVVPGAAVVVRDDEARAYVVEGETRDGRPGWEVWALEDLDSDGVFRRLVTYPSEQREQAFGFAEHVNAKARPAFLDCAHVSGSADGRTCDACHLPMPGRS